MFNFSIAQLESYLPHLSPDLQEIIKQEVLSQLDPSLTVARTIPLDSYDRYNLTSRVSEINREKVLRIFDLVMYRISYEIFNSSEYYRKLTLRNFPFFIRVYKDDLVAYSDIEKLLETIVEITKDNTYHPKLFDSFMCGQTGGTIENNGKKELGVFFHDLVRFIHKQPVID